MGKQTSSPFLALASPIRITSAAERLSAWSDSWRSGVRGFTLPTTASPFCGALVAVLLQLKIAISRLNDTRYFIISNETLMSGKGSCNADQI
jgi:hypothetical protein